MMHTGGRISGDRPNLSNTPKYVINEDEFSLPHVSEEEVITYPDTCVAITADQIVASTINEIEFRNKINRKIVEPISITCDTIAAAEINTKEIRAYSIGIGYVCENQYHLTELIPKAKYEGEKMVLILATNEAIHFEADYMLNWIDVNRMHTRRRK